MIALIDEGSYTLAETKNQIKILTLANTIFAWVNTEAYGELLVTSHKEHTTDTLLAAGKFRLYEVKDEKNLTDLTHLELLVGEGRWQGYLLPRGLPTDKEIRHRIIPTNELITKSK